jgi:hypothetical protein
VKAMVTIAIVTVVLIVVWAVLYFGGKDRQE